MASDLAATDGNLSLAPPTAKRRQLPDEVASYVRELIMSGQAHPGDFLRTDRIADVVGVSNTPVREGLLALRGEGLVQLIPRRGFMVTPFSQQDVRDVFWAHAQIASELAGRVAKSIGPELLARLDTIVGQHDNAIAARDQQGITDHFHAFHREINLAAGSPRLVSLLGGLVKQLPKRFYAAIETHATDTSDEHRLIVDALRRHDAAETRTLMERHIVSGGEQLIGALAPRDH